MRKAQIYFQAEKLADQEAERLKTLQKSVPWSFIFRFNLLLRREYKRFVNEIELKKKGEHKLRFITLKIALYEDKLELLLDKIYQLETRLKFSPDAYQEIEENHKDLLAECYLVEAYIHFYEFALTFYQKLNG